MKIFKCLTYNYSTERKKLETILKNQIPRHSGNISVFHLKSFGIKYRSSMGI